MGRGRANAMIVVVLLISIVAVWALTGEEDRPTIGPSPSDSPLKETQRPGVGKDIGLGFPACDIKRLRGIDFLGDGADGTAWTATTLGDNGRCRVRDIEDAYLVAVDVTGDGRADTSWAALEWCVHCRPFAATDLDDDGDDELVVLLQGGSVNQYGVFTARESGGSVKFGPVLVGEPGNRQGGYRSGHPTIFWVGGDEGFSGAITCEGYPEDPVLVIGWSNQAVEGPYADITEVDLTHLVLRDGVFDIIDSFTTKQPTEDPMPEGFPAGDNGCGLDLNPLR